MPTLYGTLSLGELIDLLKQQLPSNVLLFDLLTLVPRGVDSYRGYYDHLAISFDADDHKEMTVEAFTKILEEAIGKEFTGYKGGEYVMDRDTPVWVSNYSKCDRVVITGVERLSDSRWTYIKIKKESED